MAHSSQESGEPLAQNPRTDETDGRASQHADPCDDGRHVPDDYRSIKDTVEQTRESFMQQIKITQQSLNKMATIVLTHLEGVDKQVKQRMAVAEGRISAHDKRLQKLEQEVV
ncbi:unnamed protein product [Prorocentrum cordatum]|uniref:Uncharacterized protein n=1 Tax=Prorocentrum cordatum TaxID=2364126 RepID=A0ABN9XZF0_9DINO|nr:unnamed protein product [Polarella glacialis]